MTLRSAGGAPLSRFETWCEGCTPLGICFALYLFSTGFDFLAIVPGFSFARLTGVLLLVFVFLNAKLVKFKQDVIVCALVCFMGFALFPFFAMDRPSSGINQFFSTELSVLIALLAYSLPFKEKDIQLSEIALVALGLAMCVLLFTNSGNVGTEWVSDRLVVNIAGSQQDPNEFCGYYVFAVSFLTYWGVKKNHWWNFAFVALVFYCILLTGSRGGLIANAAALLVALAFAFKQTHKKMRWFVLVLILAGLLLINMDSVLASLPPSVAQRFLGASVADGTASFRTHAWSDVLGAFASSDILKQLFGHGFGSTTEVTFNGLVAHNSYIEVLYTFGIAGLLCYVTSIGATILKTMNTRSFVCVAAIIGFLVLVTTLSAYSFKPFWGVIALSLMSLGGNRVDES